MKNKASTKKQIIANFCRFLSTLVLLFTINPVLLATSREITSKNFQDTSKIKIKIRLKNLNEQVESFAHNLSKRSFDQNKLLTNSTSNNITWRDLNKDRKTQGIDYIGYSNINENDFSIDSSLINSSNNSYVIATSSNIELGRRRYWALILIFIPICTIVGNVLVVISVVKEKNLHTVTNYFVVSLAIADLAVASTVMPFAVYYEVSAPLILIDKSFFL